MEGADPEFPKKVNEGDIMVGGRNFGCGSSREHAPIAIKGAGISAVVAESFARIFYRNSINVGLPLIEIKDISKHVSEGDELEIDMENGILKNLTTGEEFEIKRLPEFMVEILDEGGLIPYLKDHIDEIKQ
jgi:3-isopropylmalate/(R)-2-methylmalate dehydratase small subunit